MRISKWKIICWIIVCLKYLYFYVNRVWLHNDFKVEIIFIKFYALSTYRSYKLLTQFLSFFQFWEFSCIISPFSLSFSLEFLFIWMLDILENLFFFFYFLMFIFYLFIILSQRYTSSYFSFLIFIFLILFLIPKSAFYSLVLFSFY